MDNFQTRGTVIIVLMGLVLSIFIGRLFSIQVLSNEYQGRADKNVIWRKNVVPPRGNIYNRHAEIYVSNSPVFEMRITPKMLDIPDETILPKYLGMDDEEIKLKIDKAWSISAYKEHVLSHHIEPEQYGPLRENTWDFKGVSFSAKSKRSYRNPYGANFLGYIGEVDDADIKGSEEGLYRMGDLIGRTGIERKYDQLLRGEVGQEVVLKDVHNREVGSYADGELDTESIKGTDIMLGIDTKLQGFGEELMQNKKGSIVALEPSTGEILAFVSAPYYDPGILTGREWEKNWRMLKRDTLFPLFNRPLQASYPPGSIFKIAMSLVALDQGILTPNTIYSCGGGFNRNKGKPGCRFHASPLGLSNAIRLSCNSYFAATYVDFLHNTEKFTDIYDAYDEWHGYMLMMGIGRKLGVDIPYEQPGLLPGQDYYDNEKRWYGRGRWNAKTIISNSIGQGEVEMTPLQMANFAALVANQGYYYTPHFVRGVRPPGETVWERISVDRVNVPIKREHYQTVIDAMELVVRAGTAPRAQVPGVAVCGKTGTVQNPHGEDHAVFIGFAPKQNPKIAVAVVVENAGGGGSWAAPIGGLMIEQFLSGKIVKKTFEYNRIKQANFIR